MLFDIISSFIIAALSGMGVGGGGLFVIFLAFFSELPQLVIQGMNLLFFLFSASASLIIHLTRRRIYPLLILILVLSGMVGALCGTLISEALSPAFLRKLFGIMLVITGLFSLKRKSKQNSELQ